MSKLKPWYKVVTPREDLREGKPLDASEFAVHLDKVRLGTAPPDYQDPERFFDRTYLTETLCNLGGEVVRRLSGETTETSAVFNMLTQFGGGKTHALALLYHLANGGSKGDISRKRRPFLEKVRNRLHLRMEGQAHSTYYERYLDHSILSMPLYPPHYPHLVAIRQELASWFFFYFEPRERMRAQSAVKEIRHIGLMGEELASFLNTLRALDEPQFKAVEKALRMIIPDVTGIDVSVNELGEVELKILEGETPIPARVLSEGTLRILGLLSLVSAKDPPALLGFEEPENGIHPRRIRMIADLLKNRAATGDTQLIVTTHSPILPDMVSDENLFVCHKKQGHTAIDPFSTWGPLGRSSDIDKALNAEETTVSERILRGDFDA